jgi:HEAT repeat protein
MQAVGRALKVRPEEWRLVSLVGALVLCLQAGQGLGDNAASALFFLRYGVDFLPFMYLLLGVSTFALTLGYSAGLGRLNHRRFFQWLILGLIGLLLAERLALARPFAALYPILWLTVSCMGMILGTFVWNLAGEVSDPRQAKRLFPLFTSAGILGSVLGNALTGLVARAIGTESLLLLYACLLGAAYILTRAITQRFFKPKPATRSRASVVAELRSGFDFVRGSRLMQLVASASVLFSVLFFSVAFPFSKVVTASFPDEAGVAGFLGLFTSITTAVTFLVSLLLANRIYARLGIVSSILILPLTYIVGFIVFAGSYSLPGGILARSLQLVVLGGIASTAWSALFNVVPSQRRGQVLAFENGVPSQIGVVLSGVLLILGDRILAPRQVLLMGLAVGMACGWIVWRMRGAYGAALLQALRAGRLEVFSSEAVGFSGLQGEAAALSVVVRALDDSKPATRIMAAEILAKIHNGSAIHPLGNRLSDGEPAVRAAVLRALGALGATTELDRIVQALGDPEPEVREQALRALALVEEKIGPALETKVRLLLQDDSTTVRKAALVTLARLGDRQLAASELTAWSKAQDPELKIAALDTYAESAAYLGEVDTVWIPDCLDDPKARVRIAACHAAAALRDAASLRLLARRLSDGQPAVRTEAAHALRRRGTPARQAIMDALASCRAGACEDALDALLPGDPETAEGLRAFARLQIPKLHQLRGQAAGLRPDGRAVAMLRDSIQQDIRAGEQRLLKVLGLIGDASAMALVREGIRNPGSESRGAALEALETLGDKALKGEVIALFESEPMRCDESTALEGILRTGDAWKRALAIRCAQDLGLREFAPKLEALRSDPESIVREAADEALAYFGEIRPMDTLQTVSTMERVLLLRDVPIFSELSAEDLQQVAKIAREEWYPAMAEVFHEGDAGDLLYIIVDGELEVVRSVNGKEEVLAIRGAGDFVGEMAIIDAASRSATLRARSDARVLGIEGETFKGILRERPEVALAVMQSLSRRLRDSTVSRAA